MEETTAPLALPAGVKIMLCCYVYVSYPPQNFKPTIRTLQLNERISASMTKSNKRLILRTADT